jgi:signal peptidase I
VKIGGMAMAPTLNDGERWPIIRDVESLARGDIGVFRYPRDQSKSFAKRVIGLPSDRVEIRQGQVLVNGQPVDEPYVAAENRLSETVISSCPPALL